jgi:hypothetical protein
VKQWFMMAALVLSCSSGAQLLQEGFENIGGPTSNGQQAGANLEAAGWFLRNNSSPPGYTDWFQGNVQVFTAYAGVGYIGANFWNTFGGGGDISNWLLTPTLPLTQGTYLRFHTRTVPT